MWSIQNSRFINYLFTIVIICTCAHTIQSAILRPDWYPYFEDINGGQSSDGKMFQARETRTLPQNVRCPPDMTKYECYHELMAVWTRVLKRKEGIGRMPRLE